MSRKWIIIETILNELKFEPEKFDEASIEETAVYKFIINNIDLKDNLTDYCKIIAAKSISCQLYRQEQYGDASIEEDTIFDLLVDRDEAEYIEMFRYYYGEIADFEINMSNGVQVITGANFKLELKLFLQILSRTIAADLELVLQKVKVKLYNEVRQKDWYNLLSGNDCDAYEKERIDTMIENILL